MRPLPSRSLLVGRENEIEQIHQLLTTDGVRLVSLTGPGGVGKTRVAKAVAERVALQRADTVRWVELGAVRDVDKVIPAIAGVLGLSVSSESPALDQLVDYIATSAHLLILDNLEQVIEVAAQLVELLDRCPNVRLLVTSRVVLRVSLEHEFPITPLPLTHAVQLFVERAQFHQPGYVLTREDSAPIVAICNRLDGLPLAIELATARLPLLSPQELAERITTALSLLTRGQRDSPERQQTMRYTIAWSYDLLTEPEQWFFRLASTFADGFRLDMAEALAARLAGEPGTPEPGGVDPVDLLASLIDHNLIVVLPGSGGERTRYRMLETIREYGLELLTEHGELDTVMETQAQAALEALRPARSLLFGPTAPTVLREIERERNNLNGILKWAHQSERWDIGLDLANAISTFWVQRAYYREGEEWSAAFLTETSPLHDRTLALQRTGWLRALQGDFDGAESVLHQAIQLADDIDAGLIEGSARMARAMVLLHRGRYQDALNEAGRGIDRLRAVRDVVPIAPHFESMAHSHMGQIHLTSGDLVAARAKAEEGLRLQRQLGFSWGLGDSHRLMGHLERLANNLDEAMSHYAESLELGLEFDDPRMLSETIAGIASVTARGDAASAAILLGLSVELKRRRGDFQITWDPETFDQALALTRRMLTDEAFTTGMAAGSELGHDDGIAFVLSLLPGRGPAPSNVPPTPSEPSLLPDLTERETDVLRLLIEGHSDRAIADALFVSPRTVSGHVASLLAKFDVQSRTAVAVRAVRLGFDR